MVFVAGNTAKNTTGTRGHLSNAEANSPLNWMNLMHNSESNFFWVGDCVLNLKRQSVIPLSRLMITKTSCSMICSTRGFSLGGPIKAFSMEWHHNPVLCASLSSYDKLRRVLTDVRVKAYSSGPRLIGRSLTQDWSHGIMFKGILGVDFEVILARMVCKGKELSQSIKRKLTKNATIGVQMV